MKKRILILLVTLLLVVGQSVLPGSAVSVLAGGPCGENMTWALTDDGKLTISGEGEMKFQHYPSSLYTAPWYSLRDQITSVVVEPGVVTIDIFAFEDCRNLTGVTLPYSVTYIYSMAFRNCTNLTEISIPNGVTFLAEDVFAGCEKLTIRGHAESTAEYYAQRNGIYFAHLLSPGMPMGNVLYSDIEAYIDGTPIRSYNIAGNTYVVVEDLVRYGFAVEWRVNEEYPNGALFAAIDKRVKPEQYTAIYTPEASTEPAGTVAMQYLYTNIRTFLGDREVLGYNIGGATCVGMDDLAAYCARTYVWDPANLALRLETQR